MPSPAAHRYEIALAPREVTQALLILALTLLGYHAGLAIYHHRVAELHPLLLQLFDVDQENNLPTWYSAFLLLVASALLWLCARKKRADNDRWFRHWYVLVIGFLLMSVDEVAGVHETLNSVIEISWTIPAGIGVVLVGLAFLPFMLHLPRRTAMSFLLAGATYLGGAIVIEIRGDSLVSRHLKDTLQYDMTTLAEESLEMLGVILFIHALLHYMRGAAGSEHVRVSLKIDEAA